MRNEILIPSAVAPKFWCHPKRADPSTASKSADIDPCAIDSLMMQSWKLRVFPHLSSKFWCKHMPPNFGIKIILFQNYHVYTSDGSTVPGRESSSGDYYPSPSPTSLPAHEPIPQKFHESIIALWALGFILPDQL